MSNVVAIRREPSREELLRMASKATQAIPFRKGQLTPNIHIVRMSSLSSDLWFVATTANLQNLDPEVYYVNMDDQTRKAATDMGRTRTTSDITRGPFAAISVKMLQFTAWRMANGHRSVIVLDPPPITHVALWELAFEKIGCAVAWVDQYSVAHESAYRPDIKKRAEPPMEPDPMGQGSMFWTMCTQMRYGETIFFKAPDVLDTMQKREGFVREYKRAITRLNKHLFGLRRFTMFYHERSRSVAVRRLDEAEFGEWVRRVENRKKPEILTLS